MNLEIVLAVLAVWIFGWLFTFGIYLHESQQESVEVRIIAIILLFLIWPVFLGMDYAQRYPWKKTTMNEPSKNLPPLTGGKTAAMVNAPVAATPVPAAPVAVAAVKPVALFGGHRGGGKKRADGLLAGSPAAKEADRKADAERKRKYHAAKKGATLPPTLPSVAATAAGPAAALAAGEFPVPGAVAGAPTVAALAPTFVAWTQKHIERAAKLLVKIGERVEGWFAAKKIAQLKLAPHREKMVLEQFKIDEAASADLSSALAEAATIELNKRRIGGAEHSHWVSVGLCLVEVVSLKMKNWELIDKMILDDRAEKAAAEAAKDAAKN